MFLTARKLPEELLHYYALKNRSVLRSDDNDKLRRLERGVEGERLSDSLLDEAGHDNLYIFRDIYLLIEGSVTQYDTLIVSESGIIANEIKNFSGDYRVGGSIWTREGGTSLPDDATSQLRRAVGKLMRLRNAAGFNFEVDGKLIFPNEVFRLFSNDDHVWSQVVLRADLRRYFNGFYNEYSGEGASQLVDIIERHIVPNPYFKHRVEFDSVKKGLYCGGCGSFKLEKQHFHLLCMTCGSRESNETHLVRAMSDFKYLFGNLEMTSRRLIEFTGGMINYRVVYEIMKNHCCIDKKGNQTVYKYKYYDFEEAMRKTADKKRYKDYLKNF